MENQAVKEILSKNPFQQVEQGASQPSIVVVKGADNAGHFTVQIVGNRSYRGRSGRKASKRNKERRGNL